MSDERTVGVLLYPGFESLDVYGPVEAFGSLPGLFRVRMVAERAGPVASAQGPRTLADHGFADCPRLDVLLVPGGRGTREQVENAALLAWLARRSGEAEVVASVCTGSWLLARAGLLDGRRATSNKMFFAGAREQGPRVVWVAKARWVEDGKFVTSSGVSAGTDMALAVVARLAGRETAENVARAMEHEWRADADDDPFAAVWGLAPATPVPTGGHAVTPYLCVRDAASAIEFYRDAFGAVERMRLAEPSGKIGHAELTIGGDLVMLSDEYPDLGLRSPEALGGSPVAVHLAVEDADAVVQRAVARGAKLLRPAAARLSGDRSASLEDPFGHVWTVAARRRARGAAAPRARAREG